MTLKSFYTKGLTLFSLHIGSIYDPKRQSHPGPNFRPEPGDEFQAEEKELLSPTKKAQKILGDWVIRICPSVSHSNFQDLIPS